MSAAPTAWECKAGGLKALTEKQYDAQSPGIQRHYTRVAAGGYTDVVSDGGVDPRSAAPAPGPIDMVLHCPECGRQHIDAPELHPLEVMLEHNGLPSDLGVTWTNPPHRSHLCSGCGTVWRPADVATNGVAELKTVGKEDGRAPTAAPVPPGDWTKWRHRNGNVYQVICVANRHSTRPEYPPTVVYVNNEADTFWSRPLARWHGSMTPE